MDLREIERLVALVTASAVAEVTLESGGCRITVRNGPECFEAREGEELRQSVPAHPEPAPEQPAPCIVAAPMVGICHPADPPVAVGQPVEAGQVVAIIESMRLMNEVRSEQAGVVRAVLVEPGVPVEYGQALLELAPRPGATDGA